MNVPLALLLALAGGASSSKVMVGAPRAPIDPALVKIYSTPPLGAVDIAQLESSSAAGFGIQGQTDAAMARLKREAAKLGANCVVLMGVASQRSSGGLSIGGGSYGGPTSAAAWASVPDHAEARRRYGDLGAAGGAGAGTATAPAVAAAGTLSVAGESAPGRFRCWSAGFHDNGPTRAGGRRANAGPAPCPASPSPGGAAAQE